MKPYELIIFDWDGTLMNSEQKIVTCFRKAVSDVGIEFPGDDAVRNIIGLGLKEALDTLMPAHDEDTRHTVVGRYREHFLHLDDTDMPLFDGVTEGLEALIEKGYSLAVATGKARIGLDRVLSHTGLADLFIATRCSDEAVSKPHPKMVLDILAQTGTSADKAIVVGDTTYDIQMGHSAGTNTLAVCYGVHDADRLLKEKPLDCIGSFHDLVGWFNS
jgi:phosphoglycolate phosphatase